MTAEPLSLIPSTKSRAYINTGFSAALTAIYKYILHNLISSPLRHWPLLSRVSEWLFPSQRVFGAGRKTQTEIGFVRVGGWGLVMSMAQTRVWHSRLQSNQCWTVFFIQTWGGIEYLRAKVLSSNHTALVCNMDTLLCAYMGPISQRRWVVSVSLGMGVTDCVSVLLAGLHSLISVGLLAAPIGVWCM